MKIRVLKLMACPDCKGSLVLINPIYENPLSDESVSEELIEGYLECSRCKERYVIEGGIPVMLVNKFRSQAKDYNNKKAEADKRRKTQNSYSLLWNRARVDPLHPSSPQPYHFDKIEKILPFRLTKGIGLDAGCGNGSDALLMAKNNDCEIIGIDISEGGAAVSYKRTKNYKNIHIIQADINYLPFKKNCFDFIYSYGVLHHTQQPEDNFNKLVETLKPDCPILIYLYEDFNERTKLERLFLDYVTFIRKITVKLSPKILYAFCTFASPFAFFIFVLPYRILYRFNLLNKIRSRIPFRHAISLNPFCLKGDLYDRLSVPIEIRYSKEEINSWFKNMNMKGHSIRNYRGWISWGFK